MKPQHLGRGSQLPTGGIMALLRVMVPSVRIAGIWRWHECKEEEGLQNR